MPAHAAALWRGLPAQGAEAGRRTTVALEDVGVLAHVDEVDAEQAGILRVRCTGGQRFRLQGTPTQRDNGLWVAPPS
jgi:Lon protease-like protein